MSNHDLPTSANELESYAREKWQTLCKRYVGDENYIPLKPVQLTENDRNLTKKGTLGHWWVQNNPNPQTYDNDDEDDESNTIIWDDESNTIISWLKGNPVGSHDNRYGNPKILQDYLKYLRDKAEEVLSTAKDNQRAKALKNYQLAHNDWVGMVKGNGGYIFSSPQESDCKANLFHTRKGLQKGKLSPNLIRLMHWNILADGLAGSGLSIESYAKSLEKQFASPKEALVWEYRMWLILEEIAHYEPDLITLVELDGNQDLYKRDSSIKNRLPDAKTLIWWLEKIGYDMQYKAREKGFTRMGTGYFWKKDKFTPITEELTWVPFSTNTGGQIFSLMRFEEKRKIRGENKKKIAVCALHLQSDKDQEGEDNRFQQIQEALYALKYPKKPVNYKEWGFNPPTGDKNLKDYAVIITGDFNAENKSSCGKSGLITPIAVEQVKFAGFKSLYPKELPWTSWKKRPAGSLDKYTIDYVFGGVTQKSNTYSFNVWSSLQEVPNKEVNSILLPNWKSGSDHISLVVDFLISSNSRSRLAYEDGKLMIGDYNFRIESVAGTIIAVLVFTFIGWKYLTPPKPRTEKSVPTTVE